MARLHWSLSLLLLTTACTPTFKYQPSADVLRPPPENASGYTEKPGWTTRKFAVAAANPLATDAGYQIIRAGGNAIDAAIAVQMVLTLVEPQSSGIGGGAFLLFNGKSGLVAYDGRETAPAEADEKLFIGSDGKAMPFNTAVVGGRSVGTPGAVKMLELAHKEHGRLPWATLFQPAIQLAEQGFPLSPRLQTLLKADPDLKKDPVTATYFYQPNGEPWPVGHLLKNPELAGVLRQIAIQGAKALYEGEVARAIVQKVRSHPTNPGKMSLADLASYQPVKRNALCHAYQAQNQNYRICGFPPPSSGGIAVGQILGILSKTNAASLPLENGLPSAQWLHLYTEASRLAFADRAQYIGDPAFVSPPAGRWESLLDDTYLQSRAKLIGDTVIKDVQPGTPPGTTTGFGRMAEQIEYGTSHISIVDTEGNALAMTTTIESGFGSKQMVKGFLLNNELTDFSFAPTDGQGKPVANRVQPGKRPRSSMAPTLVFDDQGKVIMSAGSPGGALIIHYTAKTLYGSLNWGLTPQQAINLPNFAATGAPTQLEEKRFPASTIEALKTRGHDVREVTMTSGLQALKRVVVNGEAVWQGGADPRREGIVKGD
ncbi:gamma-glutamyltransferase [Deinococcus antarcticus]|uniref:Glutathione hydrolase proenzyme n=1 Tax=Deinococcus antarcticus TaxID=1298767 RepID=A0ABV8A2F2_9DEIO